MFRFLRVYLNIMIPRKPQVEAPHLRQLRNDSGMPRIVLGENEVKPRVPTQPLP